MQCLTVRSAAAVPEDLTKIQREAAWVAALIAYSSDDTHVDFLVSGETLTALISLLDSADGQVQEHVSIYSVRKDRRCGPWRMWLTLGRSIATC